MAAAERLDRDRSQVIGCVSPKWVKSFVKSPLCTADPTTFSGEKKWNNRVVGRAKIFEFVFYISCNYLWHNRVSAAVFRIVLLASHPRNRFRINAHPDRRGTARNVLPTGTGSLHRVYCCSTCTGTARMFLWRTSVGSVDSGGCTAQWWLSSGEYFIVTGEEKETRAMLYGELVCDDVPDAPFCAEWSGRLLRAATCPKKTRARRGFSRNVATHRPRSSWHIVMSADNYCPSKIQRSSSFYLIFFHV